MKTKNKCLPYCILEDGQYIFIGAFKDPVRKGYLDEKDFDEKETIQIILPIASIINEKYLINDEGIIELRNPYCNHCNSSKFIRKGYNEKNICLEPGIIIRVKVKRYQCKRCRIHYQVFFPDQYEPYCNFSVDFKKRIRNLVKKGHVSLRNLKYLIEETMGVSISHESIRKCLQKNGSLYFRDDTFKPSGYYGFDSQWVRIKKKWHYRFLLFDTVNYRPLAESIVEKETAETVKDFIVKSTAPYERKGIVTDKNKSYEKTMKELGFEYQLCLFHLHKNIIDLISKETNKIIKEYKKELEKENPKMSKAKIQKLCDDRKKEVFEYFETFVELFFEFRSQQSWEKAKNYIELLKREMGIFPEFLQNYINENFMPNYKTYIKFLEKPHKGKLEPTNNGCETYFGNTLDKHTKRIYKTMEGLFSFICIRREGWIENRKLALTN